MGYTISLKLPESLTAPAYFAASSSLSRYIHAASDTVKVYAAGNSGARDVGTIPYGLVASCSLHLIHLVVDGPYRVVRQLNLTRR